MQTLYQAEATSTGGRTGSGASSDGRLKVALDTPKELGGAGGEGTNPEQLFAVGYSACFLGALKLVAGRKKIHPAENWAVTARVGIGKRDDGEGLGLDVALEVSLPGISAEDAEALVAAADVVCPYSYLAHHGTKVRFSVA